MSDTTPNAVEIPVKCDGCGVEGGNNVLLLDASTIWECPGCGAKNYYKSPNEPEPAEVRELSVTETIEATSSNGG